LEHALRKLPTDDPVVAEQMSRLAHRLINKLLHEPTLRLKAQAAQGNAEPYARAIQDLFSLEDYLN
jgi:glutamyl-tRNA reductase